MFYYFIQTPFQIFSSEIELNEENGYPDVVSITEADFNAIKSGVARVENGEVVYPGPETLEEAKQRTSNRIENEFRTLQEHGFVWNGAVFRCFPEQRTDYSQMLQLLQTAGVPGDHPVTWFSKEGPVTDNFVEFVGFMLAYGNHVQGIRIQHLNALNAVKSATTIEALEEITLLPNNNPVQP